MLVGFCFLLQISHSSDNIATRYNQKSIFNMASICHLESVKLDDLQFQFTDMKFGTL